MEGFFFFFFFFFFFSKFKLVQKKLNKLSCDGANNLIMLLFKTEERNPGYGFTLKVTFSQFVVVMKKKKKNKKKKRREHF